MFSIFISFLVAAGVFAQTDAGRKREALKSTREIKMIDSAGKVRGTAHLTPVDEGVKVVLNVEGLTTGMHGFHFHERGECKPPGFDSAGSHFNPGGHDHGHMDKGEPHAGDMPNIQAGADGRARVEVVNKNVSLDPKASNSLRKKGGTALIVHEKADDYTTQPTGDAGARVLCGEIK